MDRLVVEPDPDPADEAVDRESAEPSVRRRCVACGYTDTLSATASREPRNRLDGGLSRPESGTGAQVVRLIDPGAPARGGKGGPPADPDREPDGA
jgi:hypothetical protein